MAFIPSYSTIEPVLYVNTQGKLFHKANRFEVIGFIQLTALTPHQLVGLKPIALKYIFNN